MKIIQATESNYEDVIKLYNQFIGEITSNFDSYSNFDNDSYEKFLSNENAFMYLSKTEGEIVGFIAYSIRDLVRYPRQILEIEELFILKEHRGKGIGKELVTYAIKYARGINCWQVMLGSGLQLKKGHKFYERLGFEKYEFRFKLKLN